MPDTKSQGFEHTERLPLCPHIRVRDEPDHEQSDRVGHLRQQAHDRPEETLTHLDVSLSDFVR